jgi:FAD/FMN-containing dehydrogenase
MKAIIDYLRTGLLTTWNIVAYLLSGGKYLSLEGRVRTGVFRNWIGRYRYRPLRCEQPATIEELADLVRQARRVRLFGAGHSFNSGVVAEETLISLDNYSGVLWRDSEKKQLAVKGGTRVRDVAQALHEAGWAFTALPSHNAQSMGGILSTDVHGTGRDWGFVSESIVGLTIVNGRGEIIKCEPSDPLFRAAMGGVGAVGIIAEVIVQAVDRFSIEQKVDVADLAAVEQNLDRLLQENDHFSLYLFPFTDQCQVNTWNRTARRHSFLGPARELVSNSVDALLAGWFGDPISYGRLLPTVSPFIHRFRKGTKLVLESAEGFNRNLYHVHQELEFTVPFEQTFAASRRFLQLYEEMYATGLPYTIIELRFTPAGHDCTLLGAGQAQHSTWINLVTNDLPGFERYFDAAEQIVKEIGGRPHLGKYCHSWTSADFQQLYPERFATFQQLMAQHDPEGKFVNSFTQRLFSPVPNPVTSDP